MDSEVIFQSIGTVLVFLAFMALFWWVFIAHKKSDFDEAANLPFLDDDDPQDTSEEKL